MNEAFDLTYYQQNNRATTSMRMHEKILRLESAVTMSMMSRSIKRRVRNAGMYGNNTQQLLFIRKSDNNNSSNPIITTI